MDLGKRVPYEHFSSVTRMKAGWILASRMVSSCIACCILHIISFPFNCSDAAWRVADGKRAEISHILTQGEICPAEAGLSGQPAGLRWRGPNYKYKKFLIAISNPHHPLKQKNRLFFFSIM